MSWFVYTKNRKRIIQNLRFRKSIAEMKQVYQEKEITVTISLGVSELSKQLPSPSSLLERADEALYQAKGSGRNQVVALS